MPDRILRSNLRWFPVYHVAAPGGWINDPNGLVFYQGRYHVFYQHHPYSAQWGPMHWGHASSEDLVHWQDEPIALAPGNPGEDDEGGIWSGSSIEHDGTLFAFYTGNRWVNGQDDTYGKFQTQMLATSNDGIHFEKHGAVIPTVKADARDPKVFEFDGRFYLTIGAEVDGRGQVLLYSSDNLFDWHEEGTLYQDSDPNVFMIECPDFFQLGDKWVLLYGPMVRNPIRTGYHLRNGHNAGYVIGTWSPGGEFVQETAYRPIDWGHHFYAPQTFKAPDGRRIMFGWMGEFAHALASQQDGWSGQISLPRELRLREDLTLASDPAGEVYQSLTTAPAKFVELAADTSMTVGTVASCLITVSIETDIEVPLQAPTCEQVILEFKRGVAEPTRLVVDTQALRVHLVYGRDNGAGTGYRSCPWVPGDDLQIFLDRGSIEVFVGDNRDTLSSLDFAGEGDRILSIESIAGPANVNVAIASLSS